MVFLRGEERLAGERLEIDLDTGDGHSSRTPSATCEPGVFVEGKTDRARWTTRPTAWKGASSPPARSRIRGGSFSASLGHDRGERQDRGQERRLQGEVRARLLPSRTSTTRSARTSAPPGFSSPTSATRRPRASTCGTGFFWAMGRSFDQTFYADHYSQHRLGLRPRVPLRCRTSPSRGTFRTYVFRTTGRPAASDYDLDWNALQMLPGKVRATPERAPVQRPALPAALPGQLQPRHHPHRALRRSALQRSFGLDVSSVAADATDTYLRRRHPRAGPPARRSACASFPQQIGKTGIVFGYEARAETLQARLRRTRSDTYSRFDFAPAGLAAASRIELPPRSPRRSRYRYTHYATSLAERRGRRATVPGGPPSTARSSRARSTLRGPDLLARLRHPRRVLLRPLQARDRARGHLDLPDARRRLRRHPEVRRHRLLPRDQPDRLRARAAPPAPSARGPTGKADALRVPVSWRARPDLLRPDRRRARTTSTPTTRRRPSAPAARPRTSRPSSRGSRLRPTPSLSVDFRRRVRRELQAGPPP